MKKFAFGMLAASALMMTGCASDEPANGVPSDGRVTFELTAPDMAPTRAIGQNEAVNDLRVVIFDKDGNYLHTDKFDNKFAGVTTATVDLNLVKGESYQLAFWVDNNYGYKIENGVISMGYGETPIAIDANDDTRDAYYATAVVTVGQDYTKTVTLRRPFAQVNFGAADYAYAATLNKDFSKSNFTVKKVYDKMNLCSGVLSDEQASVTFKVAGHPAAATTPEALRVNSKDYGWIGMNYILVGADGGTLNKVELELFDTNDNKTYSEEISYTSVPVKRNFRTNILGDLFTAETEWDLEIDQNFNKPDLPEKWDGSAKEVTPVKEEIGGTTYHVYKVSSPSELAWAAQHVIAADAYIRLEDNMDLNDQPFPGFGSDARKGADSAMFQGVFDGNGKVISNLKVLNNNGDDHGSGFIRTANNATIKNVTIDGVTMTSYDFIGGVVGFCKGTTIIDNCHVKNCNLTDCNNSGGILGKDYGTGVTTISNCTVTGYISGENAGGIVAQSSYNLNNVTKIVNCKNYATVEVELVHVGDKQALNAGGMIGLAGKGVELTNCENQGSVGNILAVANDNYCGSMVGYYSAGSTDPKINIYMKSFIHKCKNYGELKGKSIGTILGLVRGNGELDFQNNKNYGKVNYATKAEYGNFGGYGSVTITTDGFEDLYTE